jgi:hypothetical protein
MWETQPVADPNQTGRVISVWISEVSVLTKTLDRDPVPCTKVREGSSRDEMDLRGSKIT